MVAGDAKRSLFFNKVNCTDPGVGKRMPPGGHIPSALQALLYDWIEHGAYGENPADPATRERGILSLKMASSRSAADFAGLCSARNGAVG